MPEYLFQNPETKEIISVIQGISEDHVYSENGVKFDRVFLPVSSSVGSKQDGSYESFQKATTGKRITLGDAWEISKESSERREKSEGRDKVKRQFFDDYSTVRKGKKHLKDK